MKQYSGNVYSEVLAILDKYYREVIEKIADEIKEKQDDFDLPFLGNAEIVIEKNARIINDFGIIYHALQLVGEALYQDNLICLDENEFICFFCRAKIRKEEKKCPKCSWSWEK